MRQSARVYYRCLVQIDLIRAAFWARLRLLKTAHRGVHRVFVVSGTLPVILGWAGHRATVSCVKGGFPLATIGRIEG